VRRELVVSEVALRDARRDDQKVVVENERAAFRSGEADPPLFGIDADDLGHGHGDVLLPAEDLADRGGDVAGREARGRHLVEQRLEKMVVLAVDDSDPHRRASQRSRRREAAEPPAQNHHARLPRFRTVHSVESLSPAVASAA
jgi:hypothetical protein